VIRARENNVKIIILPAHTTHKMAVFKSLKSHYDKAVDLWLREHQSNVIQVLFGLNTVELRKLAYELAEKKTENSPQIQGSHCWQDVVKRISALTSCNGNSQPGADKLMTGRRLQ